MLSRKLDENDAYKSHDIRNLIKPARIAVRTIARVDDAKDRNRFHDSAGDDADGDGEKRHIQKCTCRLGKKSRRRIMSRMHKLFRHRLGHRDNL